MFPTRNLLIFLILSLLLVLFYIKAETFTNNTNYVKLIGDCSGNNINILTNTNLEKCKEVCNNDTQCKGFSINNDQCITKSYACDKPIANDKKLLTNVWNFFKKVEVKQKYHWKQITGALSYVSISPDGNHIWGCNEYGNIYYRNGYYDSWQPIPGNLSCVSVSNNNKIIWGVNKNNRVYYRLGREANWTLVPDNIAITQISVSADGNHVWGVNQQNYIYYRPGINGQWQKLSGRLTNISGSNNGDYVYGVNRINNVYYKKGPSSSSWIKIKGQLKQIAVSGDAGYVFGCDKTGKLLGKKLSDKSWDTIPINKGQLKMISTNNDGTILIAITNNYAIWYGDLIKTQEEEEETPVEKKIDTTKGINITSASYGSNCDEDNIDNQLSDLSKHCNGKKTCQYTINIDEPQTDCKNNYLISYTCNDKIKKNITLEPEANGKTIIINCPDHPNDSWTLLFRQSAGTYLTKSQWLSLNTDNPYSNNYSILSQLDNSYKNLEGKFTFKLLWPEKSQPNHNIWSQTSNPIKNEPIQGYQPIDINYDQYNWGGIVPGGEDSLLDGSVNSEQWWYAIGTTNEFVKGIPGGGFVAKRVELYILKNSDNIEEDYEEDREEEEEENNNIYRNTLHQIDNCNQCGIYWCDKNMLKNNTIDNLNSIYNIGAPISELGCDNLDENSKVVRDSKNGRIYVIKTDSEDTHMDELPCKFNGHDQATCSSDQKWLPNHTLIKPYKILGQTTNKEECLKLCKKANMPACSYNCKGCMIGPGITPTTNENCFSFAKTLSHNLNNDIKDSAPTIKENKSKQDITACGCAFTNDPTLDNPEKYFDSHEKYGNAPYKWCYLPPENRDLCKKCSGCEINKLGCVSKKPYYSEEKNTSTCGINGNWLVNHNVVNPYKLLGKPKTREECYNLCLNNNVKGCSFQCNGCFGSEGIKPRKAKGCFLYGTTIINPPPDTCEEEEEETKEEIEKEISEEEIKEEEISEEEIIEEEIILPPKKTKCPKFVSHGIHGIEII